MVDMPSFGRGLYAAVYVIRMSNEIMVSDNYLNWFINQPP